MKYKDVHPGMILYARDQKGVAHKVKVISTLMVEYAPGRNHSHEVECVSPNDPWKGRHIFVKSRSLFYKPPVKKSAIRKQAQHMAREELKETERLQEIEQLEVIRMILKTLGLQAGIGNVFVPGLGHRPGMFFTYENCTRLQDTLKPLIQDQLYSTDRVPDPNGAGSNDR